MRLLSDIPLLCQPSGGGHRQHVYSLRHTRLLGNHRVEKQALLVEQDFQ